MGNEILVQGSGFTQKSIVYFNGVARETAFVNSEELVATIPHDAITDEAIENLNIDEDGYIKIVDRIKDMLNVSGYKVYSVHVEDVLVEHPDIEIAAIEGVKDPKRPGSEIVKAFIQLKEGVSATDAVKESIKKFAAENLSKYENPKQWEFREEIPLTMVGKVLKRELRDEANQ